MLELVHVINHLLYLVLILIKGRVVHPAMRPFVISVLVPHVDVLVLVSSLKVMSGVAVTLTNIRSSILQLDVFPLEKQTS